MSENESIESILAEMRREVGDGKDAYCGLRIIRRMDDVRVRQYCDRLEAAWKRDEERAVEHATRHAEAVARDNCRDCVHNPKGKNFEGGNAAAMREALVAIRKALFRDSGMGPTTAFHAEVDRLTSTALSAPPRNCDVGSPEEQEKRWHKNCGHGIPNCKHCKVYGQAKESGFVSGRGFLLRCSCKFVWAQMPYDAEEGGAK